ncbi:MAG: CBS domain-containing protein [Methanoregulaceae archaeon]
MQAQEIMSSPVHVVAPSDTVAHARNLMVRRRISRVLVIDGGVPVGILTKKDIAYRIRYAGPDWRRRPLDQILIGRLMVPSPVSVSPDTGIREIAALFVDRDISSVPVLENGKPVGVVTKSDIMQSRLVSDLKGGVTDVMEDVPAVSRFHSLVHVIDVMSERNDKVVVLEKDGSPAGIITETNLAFFDLGGVRARAGGKGIRVPERTSRRGHRSYREPVRASVIAEDVMTTPVVTLGSGAALSDAVRLMREHRINSVVVMEDSQVLGIVKRDDIIKEVAK